MKALRRILTRFGTLLTRRRHEQRLREEFDEHIALLTADLVRSGATPAEARRQAVLRFGAIEAIKDAYRDQRGLPRLNALASDVVFGWRQLNKHRVASAAALLSLAIAIGSATAAFRLIDAVLLRPLPVAEPGRLFFVATSTVDRESDEYFDYPTYLRYRDAIQDRADAMVVGGIVKQDVTFGAAGEPEKIYRQYVSGNLFGVFGLQPALGRLVTPNDDVVPGAHPVAVLSHDFWTHRFARDPGVIGTTFRMGKYRLEIIGVAPMGFIGTEPGEVTDIFIPAMMNAAAIHSPGWSWFRMWVRPKPGVSSEHVQKPLQAVDARPGRKIELLPASAGASRLQRQYRRPLLILSLLVVLVLLVACFNVANLMTAQAAARTREMALRVSIGAGRGRLVQLMLVESAMLAAGASALGTLFASWFAPLVTVMLRVPGDPVRLILDTGWRELAFSVVLTFLVALLFGLAPALRASSIQPVSALKGAGYPHSHHRLMSGLLSAQIAFCVLVLFVAGLFLDTFQRLANRPLGFSPDRVLVLEVSAGKEQPAEVWMRVADQLRQTPGVQSVSLAGWPLLSGNRWTGSVRVPGRDVDVRQPYFLSVGPGFFETMRIGLLDGREFRHGDVASGLGVAIVNEAFARAYFHGQNPVGRPVVRQTKERSAPLEIVGYVRDAAYANPREPIRPTVYVPLEPRGGNTLLVRTAREPEVMAQTLRRKLLRARPDLLVHTIQPQTNFVLWHLVRERLLATLSLFFGVVALVLAGIGLYGVLNYSVSRRRREISIRLALGARSSHVVRDVTAESATVLCLGVAIGVAGGWISGRWVEALLFEVKAGDPATIVTPILILAVVALLAGLPPAIRALRMDPAHVLRGD